MRSSICSVVLEHLKIPYTKSFLTRLINEKPYNNSLLGVSLVLNEYNIKTSGVRFIDKYDLEISDLPFVSYYDVNLVYVNGIDDKYVEFSNSSGVTEKVDKDLFISKWNGTALLINSTCNASEPNYRFHKKNELINRFKDLISVVAVIGIVFLAILFQSNKLASLENLILLLNIGGCYISYLLLLTQFDIHNRVASYICGISEKANCKEVISSDGASFLGIYKFSEIGAAYFAVNVVLQLLGGPYFEELAIFSALVVFFSLWSIWYQLVNVKKLCNLCNCVLLIMWLQLICYYLIGAYTNINFEWSHIVVLFFCYLVILNLIDRYLSYLEKSRKVDTLRKEYGLLKYNRDVIDIFRNKKVYKVISTEDCGLVFGDPDASIELTIYTNPYCQPCADLHSRIHFYPREVIRIRYIMTYFSDSSSIINKYFIAAYYQLGEKITSELFNKWFLGGKRYGEKFFSDLSLDINTPDVIAEFNRQINWRTKYSFRGTPTVIFEGKELEWPYSVEDITIIRTNP